LSHPLSSGKETMSGETEADISAWTVDSLRVHLIDIISEKDDRIAERDRRYEQRFESQEKAISTAMTAYGTAVALAADRTASEIDGIRERFDILLAERELRYAERYEAGQIALSTAVTDREKAIQAALAEREKAVQAAFAAQETAIQLALAGLRSFYDTVLKERDERYGQRFESQESAHQVAMATLEKEFNERVVQVRNETVLAMSAAEKAIAKAETATERRFDSVNEFRAQQADIIQTFARKSEVETRLGGLTEKVENYHQQTGALSNHSMPRAEYERAHHDLEGRVVGLDKSMADKFEQQAKAFDARIALLQAQLNSIEAVVR